MTDESAEDGSKYPAFLLDYLYVDVARIRSYLAQLAGGVPTTASEALEHARSRTVEASVPVAKGRGSSATSERWETTRSLGDLIVPAFEEEATAAGYHRRERRHVRPGRLVLGPGAQAAARGVNSAQYGADAAPGSRARA